jgi:hypothetical protein
MIKIISAQCISVACPSTFTGTTAAGQTVYARYRCGHLSVRIDDAHEPRHGEAAGRSILEVTLGGEYDGSLDYADLRQHTAGVVEWPDQLTAPDPRPAAESTDPADILTL